MGIRSQLKVFLHEADNVADSKGKVDSEAKVDNITQEVDRMFLAASSNDERKEAIKAGHNRLLELVDQPMLNDLQAKMSRAEERDDKELCRTIAAGSFDSNPKANLGPIELRSMDDHDLDPIEIDLKIYPHLEDIRYQVWSKSCSGVPCDLRFWNELSHCGQFSLKWELARHQGMNGLIDPGVRRLWYVDAGLRSKEYTVVTVRTEAEIPFAIDVEKSWSSCCDKKCLNIEAHLNNLWKSRGWVVRNVLLVQNEGPVSKEAHFNSANALPNENWLYVIIKTTI